MTSYTIHFTSGPLDGHESFLIVKSLPLGLAMKTHAGRYAKYRRDRCRARRTFLYRFVDYSHSRFAPATAGKECDSTCEVE